MTLSPNEIELYRLLERANLLQYFTNFLAKGGDDVLQLSEASKDEFDEIIELVGMKQKPLHIRRLQKSLKDWMTNPEILKESKVEINIPPSAKPYLKSNQNLLVQEKGIKKNDIDLMSQNPDDVNAFGTNIFMSQPLLPLPDEENSDKLNAANLINLPPLFSNPVFSTTLTNRIKPLDICNGIPVSLLPNAVLSNFEKSKIKLAAENLAQTLPKMDARCNSTGRKDVNKGVMNILAMAEDDPDRENQIYKYSAIYGRFNAPRRTGKPMNHHEVSVNEAAAQLCLQIPELITRRDNLFHLARQVVKMAEEIQDDAFSVSNSSEKNVENNEYRNVEDEIAAVKNEIEHLLLQESRIRESYREAKQNNQGLLMNELQKRLDDTLNQLNNKFTEQTTLATKCMMIKAGSVSNNSFSLKCDYKLPDADNSFYENFSESSQNLCLSTNSPIDSNWDDDIKPDCV